MNTCPVKVAGNVDNAPPRQNWQQSSCHSQVFEGAPTTNILSIIYFKPSVLTHLFISQK